VAGWLLCIPGVLLLDAGPRVFWTVLVASLPLVWIGLGYHRWRRLCPLGWISMLPQRLGRGGTRKIGGQWAEQALRVQLLAMIGALALRLLATNGSGAAIAALIGGTSLGALGMGLVFRGRSWCHFVCPVGLVEKVYLEPIQLAEDASSQCSPCSACTRHCQDIQLEQGYWKRVLDPSRRTVYFAWPGVVLAFYWAFWLRTGSWDHYQSGDWTRGNPAWDSAGIAGVSLLPWILVAPLVLLAGAGLSLAVGTAAETLVRRGRPEGDTAQIRHRALAVAGFMAFNLFYAFAGQPTLRLAPAWLRWALATAVVLGSAAILFRRWPKSEADFVRDRFASRLRKRWAWDAQAPDIDASGVVTVHQERTRALEARRDAYRETLVELASAGTLTRADLVTITTVRRQFGLTDEDHAQVLKGLEDSQRDLFDSDRLASAEQDLQARQLRQELQDLVAVTVAAGTSPDQAVLEDLRKRHGLDPRTWQTLWHEVVEPSSAVRGAVEGQLEALEGLSRIRAWLLDRDHPALVDLARHLIAWHDQGHRSRLDAVLGAAGADLAPDLRERLAASVHVELAPQTVDPADLADRPTLAAVIASLADGQPDPHLAGLLQLRGVGLFHALEPPHLIRLAERVEARSFAVDQPLCRAGQSGDQIFVVLTGSVRVESPTPSGPLHLTTLGPGACIGELAVLDPAPRSATVTAEEPVDALVLPGEAFRALALEQPGLTLDLARELARRLRPAGTEAVPPASGFRPT